MTKREQLQEQYEDALFALLMDEYAVSSGEKALQENEQLKNDPNFEVPEGTKRRCLNVIRKRFSLQSAQIAGRRAAKLCQRVAAVGFVATLLFTAAFAASSELRISTLNFVTDVFDDCMILYSDTEEGILPNVTASWLPEGYELADYTYDLKDVNLLYNDSTGNEILVHIYGSNRTSVVDTENAEVKYVAINGNEAVTVCKQGIDGFGNPYEYNNVIWLDTEAGWYIDIQSYQETLQTLIQVAGGLIIK